MQGLAAVLLRRHRKMDKMEKASVGIYDPLRSLFFVLLVLYNLLYYHHMSINGIKNVCTYTQVLKKACKQFDRGLKGNNAFFSLFFVSVYFTHIHYCTGKFFHSHIPA